MSLKWKENVLRRRVTSFSTVFLFIKLSQSRGNYAYFSIVSEHPSGPKGRRAEPHNYHSNTENRKTLSLSFHGHWLAAWLAYVRSHATWRPYSRESLTWASNIFDIEYPHFVERYLSVTEFLFLDFVISFVP